MRRRHGCIPSDFHLGIGCVSSQLHRNLENNNKKFKKKSFRNTKVGHIVPDVVTSLPCDKETYLTISPHPPLLSFFLKHPLFQGVMFFCYFAFEPPFPPLLPALFINNGKNKQKKPHITTPTLKIE